MHGRENRHTFHPEGKLAFHLEPRVEDTNCVGKQGLPNAKFELMHNVDHEHPQDVKIRTQSLDKCILE
jgi:hypothetical protein